MNEQETIADIIAERRAFEFITSGMRGFKKINKEYKDYTDRLEAALKRERDALNEQITVLRQQSDLWSKRAAELVEKCNEQYAKLKQVGNAAKLREAALAIRADILKRRSENCWYATDSDILEKIDAALAAPPRNCDRFECATTKAAADVWRKEDGGKTAYHEWLLAPATEKEGGNDGR